jgi:hypothetical protein
MLEQLLTDWRFLMLLAGILLAIGEGRYKLSRHEKLLDADKLATANRDNATMIAEIKALTDDVRELKSAMTSFGTKYDTGTARLWTSLEDTKERLAKLEGKMNSRA